MKPFDAHGNFRPTVGGVGELRRLAVRGAGVSIFAQVVSLAVHMVSTVVLARLLTPADFGVVAMVATFSLLLTRFSGFTEAVLQRDVINHSLISNLFWISVGTGALLTIGFAAAGSLLADFYQDPRVVEIAVVLSLQIFVTGLSILHLALLKRAMNFPLVAANDIAAGIVSVSVSISLACAGWGYWALVLGMLALPLSRCIGAWILCQWIPGLPRRVAGTGAMLRFAIHVYGRYSVDYCCKNMDYVLVGWRFGAQPLGFYKKAYDLFALSANQLVRPITAVAVSSLSRLTGNPVRYKQYFLKALAVTAFVGMGLGADLTLIGKDLIRLLLGPGWEASGRIFTFLGPGIGVMLLYSMHGWIHLSIGTTKRWFRWGLIEFATTAVLFILGLRWGPAGIAVAWTTSFWVLIVPAFWYAGRPIHFGISLMIATIWKYIVASLLAGSVAALTIYVVPFFMSGSGMIGLFTNIGAVSALFVLLYLAVVILLHGGWEPLTQLTRLLREMVPQGRFSEPVAARTVSSGHAL